MKNLKARKKQAERGKTQDSDGAVAANFDYSRLSPSFFETLETGSTRPHHLNALIVGSLRDSGDDRVASGFVGGGIGDEDGDRHAAAIGQRDQPNIIRRVSHTIPRIRRCPAYASRLFLMAVRL